MTDPRPDTDSSASSDAGRNDTGIADSGRSGADIRDTGRNDAGRDDRDRSETRDGAPALTACAVRVPCSTSNLGAGFDCLGLAFDRYLDAGFRPDPPSDASPEDNDDAVDRLTVRRAGTLADLDTPAADDIVVTTFLAELDRRGVSGVGGTRDGASRGRAIRGTLMLTSEIPVGRGLGSSGAAAVAGIALAAAACGEPLDRNRALAVAVRAEGHPDNVAPSLYGGLVAVAYTGHGPRAMLLPLSPDIAWVFAAPESTISTQRARAALPQHVPHSAAVRNTSRMAALLYGLAAGDGDALAAGFNDELHVPYRLPLIPGGKFAMEAAVQAGAWACTISGSGSGMLAACPPDRAPRVLDALVKTFRKHSRGGDGFIIRPDNNGVQPRDVTSLERLL